MLRYRTRPGVVLSSVCGEYVLVAAKSVRDSVPFVSQLNESSAFLWRLLESGAGEAELMEAVQEAYELPDPEMAREAIHDCLQTMLQAGYLLQEGENNE